MQSPAKAPCRDHTDGENLQHEPAEEGKSCNPVIIPAQHSQSCNLLPGAELTKRPHLPTMSEPAGAHQRGSAEGATGIAPAIVRLLQER